MVVSGQEPEKQKLRISMKKQTNVQLNQIDAGKYKIS
jgi:hypothetical protein